jgi:molybdate transport system permease protein
VDLSRWLPLLLSMQVAAFAMVLAVVAGTAIAIALEWKRLPARDFLDALVSAPLVLPPTVVGYYLMTALGDHSSLGRAWHAVTGSTLTFSFTGAVIAGAVGSLPLVTRSVRVALESIDPNIVAAARTLGARPARVLFTIVLPLAAPGLIAGAMLAFARALGDYGITVMVAGGRINGFGIWQQPTASIHVMNEVIANREENALVMAIATTLVGVTMLYVVNRITRKDRRRG